MLRILLLAMFASIWDSTPVLAHATLVASEPRDGSVLADAPRDLVLEFNEPVEPLSFRLVTPSGAATALIGATANGNRLTVAAPTGLGTGTHALSWRVVSADGHPIGGSVLFAIGAPSAKPALDTRDSHASVQTAIWLSRVALFIAVFVGVGGVVFAAWLGPLVDPARKIIATTLLMGLAAAAASVGLQGLDLSLAPLSELFDRGPWLTGLSSPFARTAAMTSAAIVAALAALQATATWSRRVLATAALVGGGVAFLASGHVATAEPRMFSASALFLHVISVTCWFGALVPLLALTIAGQHEHALTSFSRAIPVPLVVLLMSGPMLAVIQLGRVDALWQTAYGGLLALKLVLVTALLVLAAVNRFIVTAAVQSGSPSADRRFATTLRIEIALALLLFAVVAGWRFTPPPRSLAASDIGAVHTHIHTDRVMADVTVTRDADGFASMRTVLRTRDFRPFRAKEVALILASSEASLEPIRRSATETHDDGTWLVERVILPKSGDWQIEVEVLISDFERTTLKGALVLR